MVFISSAYLSVKIPPFARNARLPLFEPRKLYYTQKQKLQQAPPSSSLL